MHRLPVALDVRLTSSTTPDVAAIRRLERLLTEVCPVQAVTIRMVEGVAGKNVEHATDLLELLK